MNLMDLGRDADFSLMPGLFPSRLMADVQAYGRFLRLADAITDSPTLSVPDKIARLETLEAIIDGRDGTASTDQDSAIARQIRDTIERTGVSKQYALDVLHAFKRDARGEAIDTWQDLLAYCRLAASPVGRYLMDLLGEDPTVCGPPTDAMCAALRILKRLRDARNPALDHRRLCIPEQFMRDALISDYHLNAPTAKGQTRLVIDRILDGVDHLLDVSEVIPKVAKTRASRLHSAIMLCRARKLVARFRREDPLQHRVSLSRWERFWCKWSSILREWLPFGR